eukprot:552129-Pleurochrysis_carterae.AAC.2
MSIRLLTETSRRSMRRKIDILFCLHPRQHRPAKRPLGCTVGVKHLDALAHNLEEYHILLARKTLLGLRLQTTLNAGSIQTCELQLL